MEQRRRSHSFHEADTIDGKHPALQKHPSVPGSDGETSSFSTEGRSADEEEFFLTEDMDVPRTRARSSSIVDEDETTSNESLGSGHYDDFTAEFGEEEPELSIRPRARSKSRYGLEEFINSPPPPPSMLASGLTASPPEGGRSVSPPIRKGALRDSELKALKAVSHAVFALMGKCTDGFVVTSLPRGVCVCVRVCVALTCPGH